jgi:hypothetical protein
MACTQWEAAPMTEGTDTRTVRVAAVLDAVRLTGMSARTTTEGGISPLIFHVAVVNGWNPADLHREVQAYLA